MNVYLFRALKSLVLALIMFFALEHLGFNLGQAMLGALIPLLLGTINVMVTTAYSLTCCVFIFAIAITLFPTQYEMFKQRTGLGASEAATAVQISSTITPANDPAGKKK